MLRLWRPARRRPLGSLSDLWACRANPVCHYRGNSAHSGNFGHWRSSRPRNVGCIHAYLLILLGVELAIALVLPIPLWARLVGWACIAGITVALFFTSRRFHNLLTRLRTYIENTPR